MNVSRVWQYIYIFFPFPGGESFGLDAHEIREVHRVAVVALGVSREGVLARMG